MDGHASSDYHNFSQASPLTHRLPTLNGAQALSNATEKHRPIPTSLDDLDATLCDNDSVHSTGGIPRGRLTEVYGPPGCGKTHFAVQLVSNVLSQNESTTVTWIDTSTAFILSRLEHFLQHRSDEDDLQDTGGDDADSPPKLSYTDRFSHMHISSVVHLLALLLHPSKTFPEEDTSLLIIDDFSNIIMSGLPQNDRKSTPSSTASLSRDDIVSKSIATRRAAMLSAVSSGLARLAASRNMAIVVLNKASSSRKPGSKNAVLRSTLCVQQWNENVTTRIAIYRDFWPSIDWSGLSEREVVKQRKRECWPLRIAEVERLAGKEVSSEGTKFVISKGRLLAVESPRRLKVTNLPLPSSPPIASEDDEEAMGNLGLADAEEVVDQGLQMPEDIPLPLRGQYIERSSKRKMGEVADSEDEDDLDINGRIKQSRHGGGLRNGFLPSSQLEAGGVELNPSGQGQSSTKRARDSDREPVK